MFYIPKHDKPKKEKSIYAILLPSLVGILLCTACMAGGSFAWFNASHTTESKPITAAHYKIEKSLTDSTGQPVVFDGSAVTLATGNYTLQLTASGDAKTGYCVITLGAAEYKTVQFPAENYEGNRLTVQLTLHEGTALSVLPNWGTATETQRTQNGDTLTYGTPPTAPVAPTTPPAEGESQQNVATTPEQSPATPPTQQIEDTPTVPPVQTPDEEQTEALSETQSETETEPEQDTEPPVEPSEPPAEEPELPTEIEQQ